MKTLIIEGPNWLEDGTSVPFEVRYQHPNMGPVSEFHVTRAGAETRGKEIEACLAPDTLVEIGRKWISNSSLEEWFPFSAQKLKSLEAECGNAAAVIVSQNSKIERLMAELATVKSQPLNPIPTSAD